MSASQRRITFFTDAASDTRYQGPSTGDERTLLTDQLAIQRATLKLKCTGLTKEMGVRSAEPSALSLLGLVRHVTDMERRWFRRDLAGLGVEPLYPTPDNPDNDIDGAEPDPGPETVAAAWRAWQDEVAFAERFVADAPHLDIEGDSPWRGTVSLRWVLIHVIQEYARHNGHADLLRERIDGAVGL
ncbi:DinB family protein [Streptomyces sp. NPDC087300]|uniref:DinB family protein n=1 Tax=Streptomyces sp. NPDC087300 TaxID=3365780 RepID=UPI00381E6309